MRRLGWIDIALLASLVPLWTIAVTLHTIEASRGHVAWPPLHASAPETPETYPTLRGFLAGSPHADSDLAPGVRLLRVGDADLRGVGPLRFASLLYAEAGADLQVELTYSRGGPPLRAHVAFAPAPLPMRTLPLVLASGLIAIAILLRGTGRAEARRWFLAGMALSLQWALFAGALPWQTYLSLACGIAGATLLGAFGLRALLLFPAEVAPATALGRSWPFAFCLTGPATSSWLFGFPFSSGVGLGAIFASNLLLVGGLLAIITRNYRRSDRAGRRQLKWVLYGLYVGLAPVVFGASLALADPELMWVYELSISATVLIPVCFFLAIVRDDFLDIDRLITETAAYTVVSVAGLGLLVQGIPVAAEHVHDWSGVDVQAAQTLLFVAIAVLVMPARRWVQPLAEAVFHRERAALELRLLTLRNELGTLDDPGKIFKHLGERLSAALEPESCIIYAGAGSSLEPVFAIAPSVPPAFDVDGPTAHLLEEHGAPVAAPRWRRWLRSGSIRGAEAASLETIRPEVIVPIVGDAHLIAFLCLGPRHSGDLYSKSEQAWLAAVAERASRQLLRFGDSEILRHGREMRQRLARYVPGAIAAQLERGHEVEPGEKRVSLMFADIRGYTPYAESHPAGEVFTLVSRYAEVLAQIVQRHRGTLVELQGDGVLAAFGAPERLPDKEACAVRAAIEIASAAPLLAERNQELSVGVGVATGPAFVGNIETVDRVVWAAIGVTTNLAARLQDLTRSLEVSIAIDEATWKEAGDVVSGFRRHAAVRIRGLSEPHDVWTRS